MLRYDGERESAGVRGVSHPVALAPFAKEDDTKGRVFIRANAVRCVHRGCVSMQDCPFVSHLRREMHQSGSCYEFIASCLSLVHVAETLSRN